MKNYITKFTFRGDFLKYFEYNEKKQHGSSDFPIQYYRVIPSNPQYEMPLHWHREFEIIRVISGTFCVYLDNVAYTMRAGDVVLVECGTLHRGEPEHCVYECLVFDIGMLRKRHKDALSGYLLPIINRTVSVKCFYKAADNEFFRTVNELFDTMKEGREYYQLTVYSLIYKLFGCLYSFGYVSENTKDKRTGKQVKVLMELLDWIDASYTESITLEDLSRVSGMNEKYLCRFFKEFTSRTPIDYINNLRIECACHELTENGLSITEAALESGFNDLSYFSKTFKKYKGMSPREYIKSNTEY